MGDPAAATVAELVNTSALVVTCGPGGVGKTTTAAAIGLLGARAGRHVVVVTIDPARRLADALGIPADAADDPHRVRGLGRMKGTLDVLMLDAERTFDRLILDKAGKQAEGILNNPIYRSIAGSLSGAQEYMAIERLHQLHEAGEHDLIVVDTPPSRHAVDILTAPDRLASFFGHPVYRTLVGPSRAMARVTSTATAGFAWAVKRLAGPQIVEDTLDFFSSISGMEDGLRKRAASVSKLLRNQDTSFVLVTSPRAEAIDEALHLNEALQDGDYPMRAAVANLVHPLPPACTIDPTLVPAGSALDDQLRHHGELTALAIAERAELAALADVIESTEHDDVVFCQVGLLAQDVHALDTLAQIADALSAPAA
jgi:anion-transporting  ArsA/GET3 family ATPase